MSDPELLERDGSQAEPKLSHAGRFSRATRVEAVTQQRGQRHTATCGILDSLVDKAITFETLRKRRFARRHQLLECLLVIRLLVLDPAAVLQCGNPLTALFTAHSELPA